MPSPRRCRSQIPTGSAGWSTSRASHPTPSTGAGARSCCRVAGSGLIRPRSHARAPTCRPAHHTSRRSGYRVCLTKRNPSCSLDPIRGRRPRWRFCLQRASRGLEGDSRLGRRQRRRGGAGGGHRIGRHGCSTGSSSSSPRFSAQCRCWRAQSGRGHAGRGVEPAPHRPFLTFFGPQHSQRAAVIRRAPKRTARHRVAHDHQRSARTAPRAGHRGPSGASPWGRELGRRYTGVAAWSSVSWTMIAVIPLALPLACTSPRGM
jgi:hypothetical protein